MEGYNHTTSVGAERRWDAMRTKWAPYDACPDCHAVAGNPCRNLQKGGWPGRNTLKTEAHANRPRKPQVPDAG